MNNETIYLSKDLMHAFKEEQAKTPDWKLGKKVLLSSKDKKQIAKMMKEVPKRFKTK
jgi:hypothetical protein